MCPLWALARWWEVTGPTPAAREQLLVRTWLAGWDVSESLDLPPLSTRGPAMGTGGDVLCRPGIGRGRGRLRAGDRLCVLCRGTVLSLRSSVPALEARLLDGASSFLAGHSDCAPKPAQGAAAE